MDLINEAYNTKISIELDDFLIERENDGTPKQFISDLNFFSEDLDLNERKITKVNHPIRYEGLTIYQADWSISDVVIKIDDDLYQLKLKAIPEIGEQIWGVLLELGRKNKKNYLLTIDNESGPIRVSNIEDFSETSIYLNQDPIVINSSEITLKKIIPSSGLIIKNDPSIPFIYFSFSLIILGTILSLIPTNQIWIFINKDSKQIFLGGLSNRNLLGFKNEFLNLVDEIKKF